MNQTAELARQFTVSLADFKSALKLLKIPATTIVQAAVLADNFLLA